MENIYPFSWLDELVENRLNPARHNFLPPEGSELDLIVSQIEQETTAVFNRLKSQTFCLFPAGNTSAVVGAYLEALSCLQSQAERNLAAYDENSSLSRLGATIIFTLNELQRRIRQRFSRFVSAVDYGTGQRGREEPPAYKILVKLSVDQIAIILKAADDTKLLMAKSLSAVFRSIIPFISTDRKAEVSWKSARSSTYKVEDIDKAAAIKALEELIQRIRKY